MLQEDPQRPTATPSDAEMYRIMSAVSVSGQDLYKFGDEERLILKYPVNDPQAPPVNAGNPQGPLGNTGTENEAINTAWRYAVDTDNDGKVDTFTLYAIFFRTPPRDKYGNFSRVREPLDARTPPMSLGSLDPACATEDAGNTVAKLVGDSGWYKLDGKLKKSFFVYTVNVPIKQEDMGSVTLGTPEVFTGTPSISALEYQQDQIRIPLSNNAVVYEDDLDISPGPDLNLNGRIFTNSNLLVSGLNAARSIRLFEVSSKRSCFYDQENSRIAVGGNVINGTATNNTATNPVEVHLFKTKESIDDPDKDSPAIEKNTAQSVGNSSFEGLYNSDAYSQRLNALVRGQMEKDTTGTQDPLSVQQAVNPPVGSPNPPQKRADALQSYFKERLRKVPFLEAPLGTDAGVVAGTPFTSYIQGSGETLRPRDDWSFPTGNSTNDTGSDSGPTKLTLRLNQLETTNPDGSTVKPNEDEKKLGDRVVVGNNLPAQRWNEPGQKFLGKVPQDVGTGRVRTPQVTRLADVGATDRGNGLGETPDPGNPFRDSFWERTAAQIPRNPLDGIGGLRVITSAGVYDRTNSFLPPPRWTDADGQKQGPASTVASPFVAENTYDDPATPTVDEEYPVVWPDTMPMSPLGPGSQVYNNTTTTPPDTDDWTSWDSSWSTPPDISANLTDIVAPAENSTTLLPGIIEDSTTARKYAKGDLRMRASAVYHYANSGFNSDDTVIDQTPFACVSSYYDPSTASTARNIISLPDDVSGDPAIGVRQAFIGSNNGIAYTPIRTRPAKASAPDTRGWLTGGDDSVLEAQANIVFPDGRFANGPLRTALQVSEAQRTLAQKAAIDSTNCAIDILSGAAPNTALIPSGAIKEVAFLNAREIKAVDRDDDTTDVNEAFTLSSPLPIDPQAPVTPAAVLTGTYNQSLEERQPLEIRVTQLNIGLLRGQTFAGPNAAAEWLLPNSGIVYASRDDALPDRSNRSADPEQSKRLSGSDSRLDPTRRPNGIMLINGQFLFRGTGDTPATVSSVADVVREKGLTLISNLPVYIQGEFNPHGQNAPVTPSAPPTFTAVEEFTDPVNPTWGNFYSRNKLNPSFACRAGDPRLPSCTGDYWRPATVLADAVTLLSDRYRFGFRNEGDFDLRNNAGADAVLRRRQRGFFNNNFVTNGLSSGAFADDGNLVGGEVPGASTTPVRDANYVTAPNVLPTAGGPLPSSYFNNFVTPVQRRGPFPEYLMEACIKLPVSECGDADWVVNPLAGVPITATKQVLDVSATYNTPNYTSSAAGRASTFQAGSTVDPPIAELQRFPRRVAYIRTTTAPQLDNATTPRPFGIRITAPGVGNIAAAAASNPPPPTTGRNSLWFATGSGITPTYNGSTTPFQVNNATITLDTRDGSNTRLPTLQTVALPRTGAATPAYAPAVYPGSQPLVVPVLQLQNVSTATSGDADGTLSALETGWIPQARETTFNLIMGANDTPSRILNGGATSDFNGGLQNLPRFLESWGQRGAIRTNIRGSFIQLGRSAFSTAPYQPVPAPGLLATVFAKLNPPQAFPTAKTNYNIATGDRRIPFFSPPTRNWGYDVGLLSQAPDLFTQKLTTAPSRNQPAEFFREVARNDKWVKTLICGVKEQDNTPATSLSAKENCGTFPY
jgi:hypothetical protein